MPLTELPALLRFSPVYQERVWGGRNLESLFRRQLPKAGVPYGESWEICDRPDVQSVVADGPLQGLTLQDLWTGHRSAVFGARFEKHAAGRFPLLIKILDAQEDLSLQVHPNDATAPLLQAEAKSEAWMVVQAKPGAALYAGLKKGADGERLAESVREGTTGDWVQAQEARAGDCLYIPGGLVHAIGGGLVIFEVQQNSDTTYRVFDWNRLGLDGQPRPLHVEDALKVIDFDAPAPEISRAGTGLQTPYFQFSHSCLSSPGDACTQGGESFVIGAIAQGAVESGGVRLNTGDFFLLTAVGRPSEFKAVADGSCILWVTIDEV